MKILKIQSDISVDNYKYIPIDDKEYVICSGLTIKGTCNNDGTYSIKSTTTKRKNPNDHLSDLIIETKLFTNCENEIVEGTYNVLKWEYLIGNYYSSYSFKVNIVDSQIILNELLDPILKAKIYLYEMEFDKVLDIIKPLLNINEYGEVNLEAHNIMGKMFENGLSVEKDLDKAFIHYLYSENKEDVKRFIDFGYGNNIDEDIDEDTNEINFYHIYKLLYRTSEKEYAYNKMISEARYWIYKHSEKTSMNESYVKLRKYLALCRKEACKWIMENNDYKYVENGNFELFLGAYLSYLKQGHEGMCTSENDNGGGSMSYSTNQYGAQKYIEEAITENNEFAILCNEFMRKAKEIIDFNTRNYFLKLKRDNCEYIYGSWYNHYWNEDFEIRENLDENKRGERIRINKIDNDKIYFTFFDEKTLKDGISSLISIEKPKVCLRGESKSGGSNEYAWSRSDYVTLYLIKKDNNQ